jgi:hypothetical protein
MDELTAAESGKYLGISREAVDLAAREGRLPALAGDGPRRFSRGTVEAYHELKQAEKVAKLARAGESPVSVAAKVRRGLFDGETGLPRSAAAKLSAMPMAWRALFSKAELAAAGVPDGGACKWCKALEFGKFLGSRPTPYAPVYVELFGGQPCGTCGPGLLRPYWAALQARVRPAGTGSSAGAVPPSAAERARAAEWAQRHPVTAAGKPVVDDDGRALVAAGLRTARARLKDAKRRSDQRHVLHLAQVIRALEADAAVVDGRVTAAARPGTLRCGHALAAGCACPRRASKGGRR